MKHKGDQRGARGAEVVVTANPGCIMQISGGLEAGGADVRVLHLAELLAERFGAMTRS